MSEVLFYSVALALPLKQQFTYSFNDRLAIGSLVKVPFGKATLTGIVTAEAGQLPADLIGKIKPITEIISKDGLVTEKLLRLSKWMSEYYLSSWGEALKYFLPPITQKKLSQPRDNSPIALKAIFKHELTGDQAAALRVIQENSITGKPFLIHGVTGSGKTEIYLRLAHEVLKQGRSVIILVPEITLIEQMRFFVDEVFPEQVAYFHSKQTANMHLASWLDLKYGRKRIAIGPRSAIFAPLSDVGLVVMDEEHDPSYKQEETPRYHARLAAWKRAELENAIFLLGSATPSLESLELVKENKIHAIELQNRISKAEIPNLKLLDMRREKKRESYFSEALTQKIAEKIEKHEGVLIFLNRRGYSTQVQCSSCGYIMMCPHCDVALTYHQAKFHLICHYCGHAAKTISKCPKCSERLDFKGMGTERVQNELTKRYPGAVLARLDRDTTAKRGNLESILSRFRNREIDILIGTQMLAKGFDFKHLTLVGVLAGDSTLQLPDFRASERTYHLLEQVAGRSGRDELQGEVIIQAYMTEHHSLQAVVHRNPKIFVEKELEHRRQWNYPPFTQMINLTLRGRTECAVMQASDELKKGLDDLKNKGNFALEILGPAPLPFYRLRNYFRWHVMIKGKDLQGFKEQLALYLETHRPKGGIYIEVDVDPVQIL